MTPKSTIDDSTEETRRALLVAVNAAPADRAALEARYGRVWDTSELTNDFEILGFAAPFVVVKRKSDKKRGSLMFQHHPRYYFSFEEDHGQKQFNEAVSKGDTSQAGQIAVREVAGDTMPRVAAVHQVHETGAQAAAKVLEMGAKAKEPWEMTRDEYGEKRAAIRRVFQKWGDWDHANKSPSTATKAYQKWLDRRIAAFREIERSKGVLPMEVQKGYTGEYGKDVDHAVHIERALREGKPVPSTVLADYPDLDAAQPHQTNPDRSDKEDHGTLLPTETLERHIVQDGVRPGPQKLAQFKLALSLRGTPPLYSQEGKGEEATGYVKIFDPCGSWTWYLTEWDGADEAFGLVFGDCSEYGYVPLSELACLQGALGIGVEIDVWFKPTKLREIQKAHQ